jgi:hypothetical protein
MRAGMASRRLSGYVGRAENPLFLRSISLWRAGFSTWQKFFKSGVDTRIAMLFKGISLGAHSASAPFGA